MARMPKIAGKIVGEVEGAEEMHRMFNQLIPQKARQLARNVQFGVAQTLRDKIKAAAPVDEGDLRASIKARRRRGKPDAPESEVVALKKGGFYWFLVEFGHKGVPAQPFVVPTVEELRPQLPQIYKEQFGKKLEQQLKREAKRAAK